MAQLKNRRLENPKLKEKQLSDGRNSLYLEYYGGSYREYEDETDAFRTKARRTKVFLKLYTIRNPRTAIERNENKETLLIAQAMRDKKEKELRQQEYGYLVIKKTNTPMITLFENYVSSYTKKDLPTLRMAINRFRAFLNEQQYNTALKPQQLNKDTVKEFTDYLKERGRGEGPHSIFARFKKFTKHLEDSGYIKTDPCKGITIRVDNSIKKDILSLDEIRALVNTPIKNNEIKRAFIFSCLTGVRFCDVKVMTFGNVDYSNKLLKFEQKKTKGNSSNSFVTIPLTDNIIDLIGRGDKAVLIFNLPSQEACISNITRWVKKAGIDKHITWHCARHSFAVNSLINGTDVKTAASLLGHSGLVTIDKYLRAIDKNKRIAIETINVDLSGMI